MIANLTTKFQLPFKIGLFHYEVRWTHTNQSTGEEYPRGYHILSLNHSSAFNKARLMALEDYNHPDIKAWVAAAERKRSLDPDVARSEYRIRQTRAVYDEDFKKWTAVFSVQRPLGKLLTINEESSTVEGRTAQEAEKKAHTAALDVVDADLETWLEIVKAHIDSGRPIPK